MLDATHKALVDAIKAIAPPTPIRLNFRHAPSEKREIELEMAPTRSFHVVSLGGPVREPLTPSPQYLWTEVVEVSVKYDEIDTPIAPGDMIEITKQLIPGSVWMATLDTLTVGNEPPVFEEIRGADDVRAGLIARLPVTIQYYR